MKSEADIREALAALKNVAQRHGLDKKIALAYAALRWVLGEEEDEPAESFQELLFLGGSFKEC